MMLKNTDGNLMASVRNLTLNGVQVLSVPSYVFYDK